MSIIKKKRIKILRVKEIGQNSIFTFTQKKFRRNSGGTNVKHRKIMISFKFRQSRLTANLSRRLGASVRLIIVSSLYSFSISNHLNKDSWFLLPYINPLDISTFNRYTSNILLCTVYHERVLSDAQ